MPTRKVFIQGLLVGAVVLIVAACGSDGGADVGEPASVSDGPVGGLDNTEFGGSAIDRVDGVQGTTWVATLVDGDEVLSAFPLPTLSFDAAGEVMGSGGCNRYRGKYVVDGESISITGGPTTRVRCAESQAEQEGQFFGALAEAVRFEITDAEMTLWDDFGALAAHFEAA